MGNSQIVSHEPVIGAPATMIEANTVTRVHRGAPEAEQAEKLERLSINTIRTLAMDAVQKANSGKPVPFIVNVVRRTVLLAVQNRIQITASC